MKEKRAFRLRGNHKPLTPDTLMNILNQTEGGERAKQTYKYLTGMNPPPEEGEIVQESE
jgi:hypothetical protein